MNYKVGEIRVVVYEEEGKFIGQCLEYDIGEQADTLEDLKLRLHFSIAVSREISKTVTGIEFGGFTPAPERFHRLWA